jgi:hypothetical protein
VQHGVDEGRLAAHGVEHWDQQVEELFLRAGLEGDRHEKRDVAGPVAVVRLGSEGGIGSHAALLRDRCRKDADGSARRTLPGR